MENLHIRKSIVNSYVSFSIKVKHNRKRMDVSLQRFIIKYIKKVDIEGCDVTFKENIGFDFRLENLRFLDRKLRSHLNNRISGSSKYKGVRMHKSGKYEAYTHLNKKMVYLGMFNTPEEAAEAYNKKAKELFGKFAYQNVILKPKKSKQEAKK
jgi:hypothetical protein